MSKGSVPGQESIRLAKKGGISSLPDADFRRLQIRDLFPSASLCGKDAGRDIVMFVPALFVFGARSLARATRRQV